MDHKFFKKTVNWLGLVIIEHLISMFLFGIIFRNIFTQLFIDGFQSTSLLVLFAYGRFIDMFFVGLYANAEMSFTEYRKKLKDIIAAGDFSIHNQLRSWLFKETVYKSVAYMIFQIPFAISHLIFGFLSPQIPKLSDFYGMDSFFYLLTGSAFFGMLLRGIFFGLINILVTLLLLLKTKGDVEEYIF